MSEKKTSERKTRVRITLHGGDNPEDSFSLGVWDEIVLDAKRHKEDPRSLARRFAADALSDHAAACREQRLEREAGEKAEAQAAEDAVVLARITDPGVLEARLRELDPERLA